MCPRHYKLAFTPGFSATPVLAVEARRSSASPLRFQREKVGMSRETRFQEITVVIMLTSVFMLMQCANVIRNC